MILLHKSLRLRVGPCCVDPGKDQQMAPIEGMDAPFQVIRDHLRFRSNAMGRPPYFCASAGAAASTIWICSALRITICGLSL